VGRPGQCGNVPQQDNGWSVAAPCREQHREVGGRSDDDVPAQGRTIEDRGLGSAERTDVLNVPNLVAVGSNTTRPEQVLIRRLVVTFAVTPPRLRR